MFDAITAASDDLTQCSSDFQSQPSGGEIEPELTRSDTNIVINEEDHLLLQVMTAGFNLDGAWQRISQADDLLEEQLCYAFSPKWGYLTACPANVGTGMRASVVLHLPALATLGRLDQVFRWLIRAGVAGRGFHGNDAWGDFYRIANGPTLGKTEAQLLNLVRAAVPTIVAYERAARQIMLDHYRESIENQVDNAFRAIKLQVKRSDEELLSLVSSIRLGLSLGLLDPQQVNEVRETFELKRLQQKLEFAIMLEQYSTATRCRDRIRQLEERRHGH
jgi:protein arginine kinase